MEQPRGSISLLKENVKAWYCCACEKAGWVWIWHGKGTERVGTEVWAQAVYGFGMARAQKGPGRRCGKNVLEKMDR